MQAFNGDFFIKNAVSGSPGGSASLLPKMTIKNAGNILFKTTGDLGYGDVQIVGSQGLALYYDQNAAHLFALAPDASGNGIISSNTHLYGFGMALIPLSVPYGEYNFGTSIGHAEWNTGGIKIIGLPSTFTNTTSAASATIPNMVFNNLVSDTVTATNSNVTYTNAWELSIGLPSVPVNNTASTAITHARSLYLAGDLTIATAAAGSGKVYTSDASGNGSWQTPAGGSSQTLDQVLNTGSTLTANRTIVNAGFNLAMTGTGKFL